jgi:hypothetical protein
MERMADTEAYPQAASTKPNSLHHEGFSRRTPKNPFARRDQPLTADLRRSAPRLLAHLKQFSSLASKFSRKPKQVVQLPRPVTTAPVDVFPMADPQ